MVAVTAAAAAPLSSLPFGAHPILPTQVAHGESEAQAEQDFARLYREIVERDAQIQYLEVRWEQLVGCWPDALN